MKRTQFSKVLSAMSALLGVAAGIAMVTPSASAQTPPPKPPPAPMKGDRPAPPLRPMAGDPIMGQQMPDGSIKGQPMPPRPPAPMMGGAAITVSGPFVFVVQNNTLYQFAMKDLKLVRQAPLGPMPKPMMGMNHKPKPKPMKGMAPAPKPRP